MAMVNLGISAQSYSSILLLISKGFNIVSSGYLAFLIVMHHRHPIIHYSIALSLN